MHSESVCLLPESLSLNDACLGCQGWGSTQVACIPGHPLSWIDEAMVHGTLPGTGGSLCCPLHGSDCLCGFSVPIPVLISL